MNKINICGTEYTIYKHTDFKEINNLAKEYDKRYILEDNTEKREPLDGFCDYATKEIHYFVDNIQSEEYTKNTIRHELVHAMLYEMGYSYHNDEEYVDKVAKWINIINKIMEEYRKDVERQLIGEK